MASYRVGFRRFSRVFVVAALLAMAWSAQGVAQELPCDVLKAEAIRVAEALRVSLSPSDAAKKGEAIAVTWSVGQAAATDAAEAEAARQSILVVFNKSGFDLDWNGVSFDTYWEDDTPPGVEELVEGWTDGSVVLLNAIEPGAEVQGTILKKEAGDVRLDYAVIVYTEGCETETVFQQSTPTVHVTDEPFLPMSCDALAGEVATIGRSLAVGPPAQRSVEQGSSIDVAWTLGIAREDGYPEAKFINDATRLVFFSDVGATVIDLSASAEIAPVELAGDRPRIAFYVSPGTPLSTNTLRLFREGVGPLTLSWVVVMHADGCPERLVRDVETLKFEVTERPLLESPKFCHLTDGGGDRKTAIAANFVAPVGGAVRAGDPVRFVWSASEAASATCPNPLFLMVTAPPETRFAGTGFVAFPSGAPGPYGSNEKLDRARAFIALDKLLDATGELQVKFFKTGPADLAWALVEVPSLRSDPWRREDFLLERHAVRDGEGAVSLNVIAGRPHVVIQDRYSLDRPNEIMASNSGEYLLHVFDNAYRVFDRKTNELLIERDGRSPRFSPTSRFVTALLENDFAAEIVDLVSADVSARVERSADFMNASVSEIAWTSGDTFAVFRSGGRHHDVYTIVPTLTDDRRPIETRDFVFGAPTAMLIDTDQLVSYQRVGELQTAEDVAHLTRSGSTEDEQQELSEQDDEAVAFEVYHNRALEISPYDAQAEVQPLFEPAGRMSVSYLPRQPGPEVAHRAGIFREAQPYLVGHRAITSEQTAEADPNTGVEVVTRGAVALQRSEVTAPGVIDKIRTLTDLTFADSVSGNEVAADDLRYGDGSTFAEFMKGFYERSRFLNDEALDFPIEQLKSLPLADGEEPPEWMTLALSSHPITVCENGADFVNGAQIIWRREWNRGNRPIWLIRTYCEVGNGVPVTVGALILVHQLPDGRFNTVALGQELPAEASFVAKLLRLEGTTSPDDAQAIEAFRERFEYEDEPASDSEGRLLGINSEAVLGSWLMAGRYVGLATPSRALYVYDLETGRPRIAIPNAPNGDIVKSMHVSNDDRYLLQLNANGSMTIYALETGESVLDGYFIDDEIIVYAADGSYDATPEGAHFLFMKFPGVAGYHTFSQFRKALYRPDRIRAVLSGNEKSKQEIAISTPPSVGMELETPMIAGSPVRLRVSGSSDSALASLRLVYDGKVAWEQVIADPSVELSVELPVPPNLRWITAVAVDKDGFESIPVAIQNSETGRQAAGRLFAIGLGADLYNSPRLGRLNYAVADARNFVDAAKLTAGRYYTDVDTSLIADPEQIAEAASDSLRAVVERAGPNDTIMLLAAGHGIRDADGRFYLAGRNSDPDDLSATALAWADVAEILGKAKGRVVLFIDACHSGAIDGQSTNDGAVEELLAKGRNITVIAGSKGRQFSQERSSLGGGVFSSALVAAMSEGFAHADTNANGVIELTELYAAVKTRVVAETAGQQTPWIARNEMIGEVPLF